LARYATHQHWLAQCQTRQQSAGLRLLAVKDITPLEGGLPVILDGTIIGAIGVCGTLYSQDAQVARARVK
jgi:glc operon protein GlcG